MTATINQSYISQFSANIFDLLEQKMSLLRPTVSTEMANGEKHFFERLGSFTTTPVQSRNQPTNWQDPAHSRRMATVVKSESSTTLDDIDKFKLLIDPTSEYVKHLASAHGRNLDDAIVSALLGTAYGGQDGTTTTAFDTTNQQIASGSTPMSVAKFNQALGILTKNQVDMDREKIYLLLNSYAEASLLAEQTFTSFFYQDSKPLADTRKLPSFRGVDIIRFQRLPLYNATPTNRCVMYTEDTVKLAMAQDLTVKTSLLPERSFVYGIYTSMMMGGVRMEEQRVVDILHTNT